MSHEMGLAKAPSEGNQSDITHQQLLDQLLAAVSKLSTSVGDLSTKVNELAENVKSVQTAQAEMNERLDRIDQRLGEGDRRMTEQDKSLVLQGKVIRSASQLKEIRKTLDTEIAQLEQLEQEALLRIHPEAAEEAASKEITRPSNPRPEPDTIPVPPPSQRE